MSTSQQADPLIGRLVDGRYRVRARIARGGMATVYVATDLRLERRVALKVMHGHLSDDTVFQSRFIQEARSAARLSDPHVVNVFDQGQDGEMAYLVMEYLPGITLRELLREHKRLTVDQTLTIMDAILSGLAAAHRAGIVHRDVKPENVLLAEDGRIKIGDFGLARATTANTASGAQLMGTIAYLAPELVTRGTADARSDIYSLGIMLYEMLTGEQPYKGEQPMQIAYQHATDSVPRPSAKNPAVPEQLDELVLWSTEREPGDRPLDAGAMLERLRAVERELGLAPQVARAVAVGTAGPASAAESRELTKVLPQTASVPSTPADEPDNAARLRTRTRRRAARGIWTLVLVLLLAAGAAGTGWYFGSGPGSLVAVPDVSQRTFAEAEALLTQEQLRAQAQEVNDRDIPAGTTVGSDPAPGERLDKETVVTVFVSVGPATHQIPALAGKSSDEVTGILQAAFVGVGDATREFSDAGDGAVLSASVIPRSGGDAIDCTQGCTVYEGDAASLVVSLGPIPDVTGRSQTQAERALNGVGLETSISEEYSNSVASGNVIAIGGRDGGGNWRPGDTVPLRVSIGPKPVEIPGNVVGMTIREAVNTLENLGFEVNAGIDDGTLPLGFKYWDIYKVRATNPKAGTTAPQGSTITLTPTL
ncbi:Stk1 family PASTA domain-containing Ser/Thr kinase [Microbacterium trichothecenolyticum]|uniref:non-specific serine/threonine protein kinase n=1 Tax=Microbacterium trichothecenolyticum TaxID=69370 RepID=A0ABU0TS79_MICTR|nr:Stk1 family PASTA domain-containing Ser/Thr kinase [Microbacterium trichothecenolyticum]MDQ1122532.1 beta-lactam-binding protein with PASTA domain/tRNA A-37 threonylcarbamoyl transferase component Bud32 [Microbacterium trichothecenolyticum]